MTTLTILSFSVAMFLLAITPGPGVFATVSKSLSSGFKNAVPVVGGIVLGDLIFLLFAIYGLSAVAETFGLLFQGIKYLGGLYLIWLGIKLWRSDPAKIDIEGMEKQSGKYSFLGGLSITLGNPKVILFYVSFLPTFVDIASLSTVDVTIIASVLSLILGSVMLFYAYTASKIRKLFSDTDAQKRMNKAAGFVMVSTGSVLIGKS